MEPPATRPLLKPEHRAMIERGASVIVSSCGHDLAPSVMRAVGSQIAADGCRMVVFMCQSQSARLLEDVARSGRLAVVFSQPSTHATVQVKARNARLREACDADAPVLQRYLEAMEHELTAIGFPAVYARAMLAHRLDDVVAIEFVIEVAFDQTPGPKAGQPITGAT